LAYAVNAFSMIVHFERYVLAAYRHHHGVRQEMTVILILREFIQPWLDVVSVTGNRPVDLDNLMNSFELLCMPEVNAFVMP
jgi:hypothetical protein